MNDDHNENNKLLLDLHQRFSLLEANASIADQQRVLILKDLREMQDFMKQQAVLGYRMDQLEPLVLSNTDFIRKMQGGMIATRMIWLALGGAISVGISWFTGVFHGR